MGSQSSKEERIAAELAAREKFEREREEKFREHKELLRQHEERVKAGKHVERHLLPPKGWV
jgi:hypothetical protein